MYNQLVDGLESLTPFLRGGGQIKKERPSRVRMEIPPVPEGYTDAQLDDTQRLHRSKFKWNPPTHLSLRMRARPARPLGTLGFGFWNDPFTLSLGQGGAVRQFPAPPQAIWFFYGSKPNDFAFHSDSPGHGWRAMCLRTPRFPSFVLLPGAALAMLFSRIPLLRKPVMQAVLRQVYVAEALLQISLMEWHTYEIHWEPEQVKFLVDGVQILKAASPPRVPLGFVAWIDNQYAVASPQSGFRFGTFPSSEDQWMETEDFSLQ